MIYALYRLFFGGHTALHITSIRIIEERANLENVVKILTILDNVISGMRVDVETDEGHGATLQALFDSVLNDRMVGRSGVNQQYILDTFECFRKNKEHLRFDMHTLDYAVKDRIFTDLLFDSLDYFWRIHETNDQILVENDIKNLLNSQMLKIFPNVTKIEIIDGVPKFSLLKFLTGIKDTSITSVHMEKSAITKYNLDYKSQLIDSYQRENFKLDFIDTKDSDYENIRIISMM